MGAGFEDSPLFLFSNMCTAGFRDMNLNLILSTGHVAEIQVHHAGIKAYEAEHHSHEHYEVRQAIKGLPSPLLSQV